jgi:hypothetical protein
MPKIPQMHGRTRAIFGSCGINQLEKFMATQEKSKQDGELSEQQLDKVAGGQEVRKMETIVVTAKREQPDKVVKMETIVVTAQRDRPDLAGTKLAQADTKTGKN